MKNWKSQENVGNIDFYNRNFLDCVDVFVERETINSVYLIKFYMENKWGKIVLNIVELGAQNINKIESLWNFLSVFET